LKAVGTSILTVVDEADVSGPLDLFHVDDDSCGFVSTFGVAVEKI
jgi:hypothetical protein